MDNRWEELFPFYAAGLLLPEERAAVEAYLAQSEEARRQVADWQAIAKIVREDVSSRAATLPPLTGKKASIYTMYAAETIQAPPPLVRRRFEQPKRGKFNVVSLSLMAAAVFMIVFFAGIAYMALQPDDGQFGASGLKPTATATIGGTFTTVPNVALCHVQNMSSEPMNIYAAPDTTSEIIGNIRSNAFLQSDNLIDGWYQVNVPDGVGWVEMRNMNVMGQCAGLPTLTPSPQSPPDFVATPAPTFIPSPTPLPAEAPADEELYRVVVIPESGAQIDEAVSSPGDATDRLQLEWVGGAETEFTLTLFCIGENTIAVRWYEVGTSQEQNGLACNVTVQKILPAEAAQFDIMVLVPAGSLDTMAVYSLIVQPVDDNLPTPQPQPTLELILTPATEPAPFDSEPHSFEVYRGQTSTFVDAVSYPDGDYIDRIHMTVMDMSPGEYRSIDIIVTCAGFGTESLTWTTLVGQKQNGCGDTLHAGVTSETSQISFDVTFSDSIQGSASVNYSFTVIEIPQ